MAEKKISKRIVPVEGGVPTVVEFLLTGREAPITFDVTKCSDDIRARLALHGASQKIGDSYAGAGKAEDPIAYAEEAINETIAQLYAGEWRQTGGGAGPKISDLAIALANATGNTQEEAQELVDSLTDEEKKAYRANPRVKLELDKLRIARAQAALKRAQEAVEANTDGAAAEVTLPTRTPAEATEA